MIIPELYFNARYLWQCVGIDENVGFSLAGISANDTAEDIALDLDVIFRANWAYATEVICGNWTYIGVQVTKTVDGQPQVGESIGAVVGSLAQGALPINCALLVRKNTASGGRKNRGRMFFPPFSLKEIDVAPDGIIAPATVASYQLSMTSWYDELVAALYQPWLLHSNERDANGDEVPGTAADPTLITSLSVQPRIATQRRRMR